MMMRRKSKLIIRNLTSLEICYYINFYITVLLSHYYLLSQNLSHVCLSFVKNVSRKPKSDEQLKSLRHNTYTTTNIFFNKVSLLVSLNFATRASEQGQQENARPV